MTNGEHARLEGSIEAMRGDLRTYIERHDRQHDEIKADLCAEHRVMKSAVTANTIWRTDRIAQERVVRYLVGSNIGVLVGLVVLVLYLVGLSDRPA